MPETQRQDIGALHGLRAIMVLLVANFHIWQQSWLQQSVSLFGVFIDFDYVTRASYVFVDGMLLLSGFLLFLPYADRNTASKPAWGRFYLRRAARILPSYLFAVLVALFCFALPQGSYVDAGAMWLDVLSHLTFTFPFFYAPYQSTPLNGVLWTVAIEMQFYLIFPLLVKATRKRPAMTLCLMAAAGWAYRFWASAQGDTGMLINQLPAFLDVYALGMGGAMLYTRLRKRFDALDAAGQRLFQLTATFLMAGGVCVVLHLLRAQSTASLSGLAALRLSQLRLRLPLAVALMGCMLSSAFLPKALEWLFSNRLMRFLAAVSYNFYIWHQFLAVQYVRWWFPSTLHTTPGLQYAFTALCYLSALAVAAAVTYGLEKPAAKAINGLATIWERKRNA